MGTHKDEDPCPGRLVANTVQLGDCSGEKTGECTRELQQWSAIDFTIKSKKHTEAAEKKKAMRNESSSRV